MSTRKGEELTAAAKGSSPSPQSATPMHSCSSARRPLSKQARVVLLALAATFAAMGSTACEVVSGLDRLEPVDCLNCESGVPGDSSSDVRAPDSPSEGPPAESGRDAESGPEAAETDVSSWDAGETEASSSDAAELDEPRSDADAETDCPDAEHDCGSCTDVHANGLGQNYVDCIPPGTYDVAQAMEACGSYTGDLQQCHVAMCGAAALVCSTDAPTSCACWGFMGAGAGHVESSGQAGALNCECPGATAPRWN
jgi:hypothetical protein